MNLKGRLTNFFKTKKVNVFLLFLGLSFSFLILTKLSKDYTQTVIFDINKTNIPEEKIIVSDSTHKLEVTLRTYGFKLLSYLFYKPKIEFDFSNIDKNKTHYLWDNKNNNAEIINQFDANIQIISINPDTLFFRYDENFVKIVPVKLAQDIQFSQGYDLLKSIELNPDSVRVIGPKVLLDSINTIETQVFKLKDVNQNISSVVKLNPQIKNEQISYSDKTIQVKATVTKFTEGEVEVPVEVLNVPDGITLSYYPKTIRIYFYTSLQAYSKITANDFKVECDYKLFSEARNFLEPNIVVKPKSVKSARLNTNKIEFIIKQ